MRATDYPVENRGLFLKMIETRMSPTCTEDWSDLHIGTPVMDTHGKSYTFQGFSESRDRVFLRQHSNGRATERAYDLDDVTYIPYTGFKLGKRSAEILVNEEIEARARK